MWFNNALIYQCELDQSLDLSALLADEYLKPCPPHARFIYGWLPPFADSIIHDIAGSTLICLGKEERVLPRNVIQRELAERVSALATQRGFEVKRAERGQIAEDIEFELLPKAFCLQKRLPAFFDHASNRLIINTSSANQGSQLIALLRKSIPGIRIEPLISADNLALQFAEWINNPSTLPANLQLASDCLLFSLDDEKKRFNCKGCELPADEIRSLLAQGLAAAEISLIWNERIQFTLTQDLIFKRLKCLDYLIDDFNEIRKMDGDEQQHDAALTLLTGELRLLFNDVLTKLAQTSSSSMRNTTNEAVTEI